MEDLKKAIEGNIFKTLSLSPVTRLDLIKYAGASGDYNPIHTIDQEAKKVNLPGIIAHGMWTMGNVSKLFSSHLERGFIEKFKVRFSGMVFLNDVLTVSILTKKNMNDSIIFGIDVINQNNNAVLKGELDFKLFKIKYQSNKTKKF